MAYRVQTHIYTPRHGHIPRDRAMFAPDLVRLTKPIFFLHRFQYHVKQNVGSWFVESKSMIYGHCSIY